MKNMNASSFYLNKQKNETYQITCHNLISVVAIIVTIVNISQVCICKVDPACGVVQGQAIGPVELSADNDSSRGSIHAGLLNPGVLSPV